MTQASDDAARGTDAGADGGGGDGDERVVGGLRIRIDRTLCVGFGDCVTEAPLAFRLDGESVAVFLTPERVAREQLLRACDACPVDALTVWDETGRQLVP